MQVYSLFSHGRDEAYKLQWDSYRGQQKHIIQPSKCSGLRTLQIGLQHGRVAKTEIGRGLRFYKDFFQKTAKLSWSQVCDTAAKFEPLLSSDWPDYCTEMKGMADYYYFFASSHDFAFISIIGGCKATAAPCLSGSASNLHFDTASSLEQSSSPFARKPELYSYINCNFHSFHRVELSTPSLN